MLRSLRSLFITGVALLDLAAALKGCPVEPHPVILVEETPIVLSTLVCSDTALTFGSITINVTSAPTLLVTSFNAITTSTLHDGSNTVTSFTGPWVTLTGGWWTGSGASTLTLPPGQGGGTGTKIIFAGSATGSFTGSFTTIAGGQWTGAGVTTMTLPPSGSSTGTKTIFTPPPTDTSTSAVSASNKESGAASTGIGGGPSTGGGSVSSLGASGAISTDTGGSSSGGSGSDYSVSASTSAGSGSYHGNTGAVSTGTGTGSESSTESSGFMSTVMLVQVLQLED
ncbi:hypothetical protein FVER53590_10554 [Fusarium verticillioides]|nr:hypothetical protein FVER53590_10554 [Fusarium verticillioides]